MTTQGRKPNPPIAVCGVSALFPGSLDATGFWRDILAGRDLITDVPASHWLIDDYYDPNPAAPDKTYAKRGAFLKSIDFDPVAFGVPPTAVPSTDTSQLLALIVAQKVLEDASRGDFSKIDRARTSVILGVTSAQELLASMVSRLQRPIWVKALRDSGVPEEEVGPICDRIAANYVPWQESSFPGLLGNVVAGRIANRFDLGGTNCITDAACASTFSAVSMAINELYLGQSDLVLTGGVDTLNDIFMFMCFSKTPALSASGDCRPFADGADGTMLGEGLGMVALRRLEDAERDGNPIYAVLRGLGAASDGRAKSVYAPLPAGQARAIERAYDAAGYGPETVELIEAHGTATKAGDAAEFAGLRLVFDKVEGERPWCALGSVKSQIGHTKAAAGAAGLFKTVMALHHKVLPPTIKVDRPNPKLELETSPFYLNTRARPWIRTADHPRRASVSSFGFGGSNFHLTFEEYRGPSPAPRLLTRSHELVVLGAESQGALAAAARTLQAEATAQASLPWTARQSQAVFSSTAAHRLSIVASDVEALVAALGQAAEALQKGQAPKGVGVHYGTGSAGSVAFLFPGQGSQAVDMGGELAINFASALSVWDRAANLGLHQQVFPRSVFDAAGKEAQVQNLRRTEWAQPAIGATSASMLAILRSLGVQAQAAAGHSFGELSALYAAGALSEADFLAVAQKRGQLMAEAAATPGAMSAVSGARDAVEAVLRELGSAAVVANHNSPTQVVISGPVAAIEAAEQALKARKLACTRLPVATAFHSPVVSASVGPFAEYLAQVPFQAPQFPVYANSTAAPHGAEVNGLKTLLAEQIGKPVRFVEEIQAMHAAGARIFLEVGPGTVLTGLVGRILDGQPHQAVALDDKRGGIFGLFNALGQLAALGVAMQLAALFADAALEDPSKKLKPKMAMPINGSNYGRPYPPPAGASALPPPNPPRKAPAPVVIHAPAPVAAAPVASLGALSQPAGGAEIARAANGHESSYGANGHGTSNGHGPANGHGNGHGAANGHGLSNGSGNGAAYAANGHGHSVAMESSPDWLRIYEETQRQTAEAHVAFQRTMADTHRVFLESMTASLAAPGLGHASSPWSAPGPGYGSSPSGPAPQAFRAPASLPVPAYAPAPMVEASVDGGFAKVEAKAPAPKPTPVSAPLPVAAPARARPQADLRALLFQVVADKTGYPVEALGPAMDLEGDLGIDSIKRVEILSTLREKAPGLPDVSTEHLAKLRTLEQIIAFLGDAAPMSSGPVVSTPARAPAAPALDLEAILKEVVAEKTGYPVEALRPELDLEGDLGIDSIKRVEILSRMRERAPGLPEVPMENLAKLRTLGQIAAELGGAVASAPPAASASPAAPALDLEAILKEVVAEKTGYPVEALRPELDLEGDLGIDSIKRVEILSRMRERAPGLPEVPMENLAKLRTLGQIAAELGGAAASAPAVAAPVAGLDLQAILKEVVAEKTGYPVEALRPELDLEGDLGIDSIKRVEILSRMRERAPGLPEVPMENLAKLRTLGQIAAELSGGAAASAPAALASPAAVLDLQAILKEVVAEKTGYPVEALRPELDLEGDLGIDSIKRVEILSRMRERAPGLPEVPMENLAKLRTLGQIAAELGGGAAAPASAPAVAKAPAASAPAHNLGRWVVEATEAPALGLLSPRLISAAQVSVTDDGTGVQAALIQALARHGVRAVADGGTLSAEVVIDLGGLTADPRPVVAIQQAALLRAQQFQKSGAEARAYYFVLDAGGTLGVGGTDPSRAALGGLLGLAKTAALEWPKSEVRGLDIARGERSAGELAEAIAEELLFGGPELEIGLTAAGQRTCLVCRATPTGPGPIAPALGKDSVFVISGGGRGVTRAIAEGLAHKYQGRFALLGRTPLAEEAPAHRGADERGLVGLLAKERPGTPPKELKRLAGQIVAAREIRSTVAALQAAGAQAQYYATDVRNGAAVAATLDEVRRSFGPIHGVIHAAGVIEDRLIADKTAEQADRVLGTKIEGLEALLSATAQDPLSLIALFGSISGRTGNIGQSDYAMANESLGKRARVEAARRGPSCVVKALAWGPWKGGMVTPAHEAIFEQRGVPLIDLASGAQLFLEELEKNDAIEVVLGCSPNAHAPLAVPFLVTPETHGYLESHRIKGVPVVPVVLALEWFVRLARLYQPELQLAKLTHLKVLRGARLERFAEGQRFTLLAKTLANGGPEATLALELRGANGELHYAAEALMAQKPSLPSLSTAAPRVDDWSGAIYGGVLFHGPRFQAIQSVGVSEEGGDAQLQGLKPLGWPAADWRTDSAVLDGGLQLALLWSERVLGRPSLPTSIKSARVYGAAPLDGDVRCLLRAQERHGERATADLVFLGKDGQVIAELEGVETHALPSEK